MSGKTWRLPGKPGELVGMHVGLISTRIAMIKTFCADAGRKYINAGRLLLTRRETGIEVCEVKRTVKRMCYGLLVHGRKNCGIRGVSRI